MIPLGHGYGNSFIFETMGVTTIENTNEETDQLNSVGHKGSKIFKANSLKIGDVIHLQTRVTISTGVSQSTTQKIMFGSSVIQATTGISSSVTRALLTTTPIEINTTIDNELNLFYQWANALEANKLQIRIGVISLYN